MANQTKNGPRLPVQQLAILGECQKKKKKKIPANTHTPVVALFSG